MKTFKRIVLVLLLVGPVIHGFGQSVDELIDKHLSAIGGKDKLLALTSFVKEGSMSYSGLDIGITISQANKQGRRVDINVSGQMGFIIQRPDSGWQYLPFQGMAKPEATPAAATLESADELDIQSPLLNYKAKGHTVELLGKEKVDSQDCFKIKLVLKSGLEELLYLDPSTYYIVKKAVTSKASGSPVTQTQSFSNYKKLDNGYVFPFTLTGVGPADIVLTKIEVNKPLDASLFIPL